MESSPRANQKGGMPLNAHLIGLGLVVDKRNRITVWLIWALLSLYLATMTFTIKKRMPPFVRWKRYWLIMGYFPETSSNAVMSGCMAAFSFAALTIALLRHNSPAWSNLFMELVAQKMNRHRLDRMSRIASRISRAFSTSIFVLGGGVQVGLLFTDEQLRAELDWIDPIRVLCILACGVLLTETLLISSFFFALQSAHLYYRMLKIDSFITREDIEGFNMESLRKIERRVARLWRDIERCNAIWCKYVALVQLLVSVVMGVSFTLFQSDNVQLRILAILGFIMFSQILVAISLVAGGIRECSIKMGAKILATLSLPPQQQQSDDIPMISMRTKFEFDYRLAVLAHKLHRRPLQMTCWNLFPLDYSNVHRTLYIITTVYFIMPHLQNMSL